MYAKVHIFLKVFKGSLKKLRSEGKDRVTHHAPIPAPDMAKIKNITTDNPKGLQQRVFVDIMLHFARRGNEGLRNLRRDSFSFEVDENGHEYAFVAHEEVEKKRQGVHRDDCPKQAVMYATGDPDCPIQNLKKYLSKLNESCQFFFQRPKKSFSQQCWYDNMVLGVNKLSKMMNDISEEAKLSQIFTNHCLRATAASVLSHSGVEHSVIKTITGHRNISSLQPYIQTTDTGTKHKCSSILSTYSNKHDQPTPHEDTNTPALPSTHNVQSNSFLVNQTQSPYSLFQNANINSGANITININK